MRTNGVKNTLEHLVLKTQKETATSSVRKEPSEEKINTSFDAIAALVHDLRFSVEGKVEKHHVESALQLLFWPKNDNVWDRAKAVCMVKAKEIFSHILNEDQGLQTPTPSLKECLLVLVYLEETREGASL